MTDTPVEETRTQIRSPTNKQLLPKPLPFKLLVMKNSTDQAVDMSDVLLLSWALLSRRHTLDDDVHFAWGYWRTNGGLMSRRKISVNRGHVVSEVLQEIQTLRKQALIPEEVAADPEGSYMVINDSSGAPAGTATWTFQIEIHETDETIWLKPSWNGNVMNQDAAVSNVHCFMDILNSVLLDQRQFVTRFL